MSSCNVCLLFVVGGQVECGDVGVDMLVDGDDEGRHAVHQAASQPLHRHRVRRQCHQHVTVGGERHRRHHPARRPR